MRTYLSVCTSMYTRMYVHGRALWNDISREIQKDRPCRLQRLQRRSKSVLPTLSCCPWLTLPASFGNTGTPIMARLFDRRLKRDPNGAGYPCR
jgi:hypothetical protein